VWHCGCYTENHARSSFSFLQSENYNIVGIFSVLGYITAGFYTRLMVFITDSTFPFAQLL
jgi:hypothetical protein